MAGTVAGNRPRWILGLIYLNPQDSRILVPLPCKLGLALNFCHPLIVRILCWIWVLFLIGLFAVPVAAHAGAFIRNPATPLIWLAAWGASLALTALNSCFARTDYRELPLASYGLVAASVGFGLQAIVNGPLVLWWGMDNLTGWHGVVLGPVCAVAQTCGKWAAIMLLLQANPAATRQALARRGLLVGLGFTVTEIALLYFPVAWSGAALGWLSLWERVGVSMFHIYSAGLVALAIGSGRRGLIVVVLVIHGAMDALALATPPLQFSLEALEATVSVLAILTWVAFLVAARPPRQDS
jgi:hypothetical protein